MRQTRVRGAGGQVIVEGTVMLLIMTVVFVAALAIGLDTWTYANYSDKIRTAAQAAARVYSSQRSLYNCMLLAHPKQVEAAEERARNAAEAMLDQLGVPGNRFVGDIIERHENGTIIYTCPITVSLLPIPFTSITGMPGSITVEGVDAIAFSPARMARMSVPTIANGLDVVNGLNMANFTQGGIRHMALNFPFFQADHVEVNESGALGPSGERLVGERWLGFFENSHPGEFPGGQAPKYTEALGFHLLGKAHNVEGKSEAFSKQ